MKIFRLLEKVFPQTIVPITEFVKYHKLSKEFSYPSTKDQFEEGYPYQAISLKKDKFLSSCFDKLYPSDFEAVLKYCYEELKIAHKLVALTEYRDIKNMIVSSMMRKEPSKIKALLKWPFNLNQISESEKDWNDFLDVAVRYLYHEDFSCEFNPAQKMDFFVNELIPCLVYKNIEQEQLKFLLYFLNVRSSYSYLYINTMDEEKKLKMLDDNSSKIEFSQAELERIFEYVMSKNQKLKSYFLNISTSIYVLADLNNNKSCCAYLNYWIANSPQEKFKEITQRIQEEKLFICSHPQIKKILTYMELTNLKNNNKDNKKSIKI